MPSFAKLINNKTKINFTDQKAENITKKIVKIKSKIEKTKEKTLIALVSSSKRATQTSAQLEAKYKIFFAKVNLFSRVQLISNARPSVVQLSSLYKLCTCFRLLKLKEKSMLRIIPLDG